MSLRDRHVRGLLGVLVALASLLPLAIGGLVAHGASRALVSLGPLAFLTGGEWAPSRDHWFLLQMVAASIVSSAGAVGLAFPVSLGLALHLRWFAGPRAAGLVRASLGILAGTPSVVFGLVALQLVVPVLRALQPPGLSLGAAILTLAVMLLPTLGLGMDAALAQVPAGPVRAAAALGLDAWETTRAVLLPLAWPGLRTATVLALTRALGETMALLMVAGNTVAWPGSLFQPVRTLTGGIAVEMAYAAGDHRSALFVSALALFALVVALRAARP
ncbi:MAG: ABC transporter permease subunit [Myxococcota bacterium]